MKSPVEVLGAKAGVEVLRPPACWFVYLFVRWFDKWFNISTIKHLNGAPPQPLNGPEAPGGDLFADMKRYPLHLRHDYARGEAHPKQLSWLHSLIMDVPDPWAFFLFEKE